MPTVNLGRIKPINKGVYSGATAYVPLDMVQYNGNVYLCNANSTGNLPTSTAHFSPLVDVDTWSSLLPSPGKIPLAESSGRLNDAWIQRKPDITPTLSVNWTLKPTAAALVAAGWTVTRAGEMTYFGPVPVKVAENLFVRSADFGNAAWAKTGLVAPAAVTDESGLVGSTIIAAATGQHALGELTTSTNIGSQTYRVRFLCKAAAYTKAIIADRTTGRAAAAFDLVAGTTIASTYGAGYTSHSVDAHELGGGLYWCNLVMTSAAAGTNWEPTIVGYPDSGATLSATGASYTGDGTSGIEVYAAQLQHNFDGDYVPTTDTPITRYESPLLTATTNELAYQHNSRGECIGLLQYPGDTNLILQSQDLSNASWVKIELSVSSSKRKWQGSVPFWRTAKTSTASSRVARQDVSTSVAAGAKYSVTIALLADQWSGTSVCSVGVTGSANGVTGANADLSAVVISGPGTHIIAGGVAHFSGLSNTVPTLVRVTRTYPLADTVSGVLVYPGGAGSTTLGASILATRVHLSASPRYMPYIPTTTAAVTRGVQNITLSGSAFAAVNNPVEGTLLARSSVEDLVWDTSRKAWELTYSNNSNFGHSIRTSAATDQANGSTANNSATQASVLAGVFSTTPITVAYSYAENLFQLGSGGSLSVSDTSGSIPAVNQLATPSWAGLIQRTELYPRAMTSAELAAITTPGVLV